MERADIMRNSGISIALCLTLAAGLFAVPPASAGHWCTSLSVTLSPTSGYVDDATDISITLYNGIGDSLDVSEIAVTFSWDTTTWSWGTMNLAPYSSDTNTYSKTLASLPGDYLVDIEVTGQATGDFFGSTCYFPTRTFRVNALPPSPSVIVTANPSTGNAPLTVSFTASVSNGLPPFSFSWTFGDGGTDFGSSARCAGERAPTPPR